MSPGINRTGRCLSRDSWHTGTRRPECNQPSHTYPGWEPWAEGASPRLLGSLCSQKKFWQNENYRREAMKAPNPTLLQSLRVFEKCESKASRESITLSPPNEELITGTGRWSKDAAKKRDAKSEPHQSVFSGQRVVCLNNRFPKQIYAWAAKPSE